MTGDNESVQARARELWLRAGQPDGFEEHFSRLAVEQCALEAASTAAPENKLAQYDLAKRRNITKWQHSVESTFYNLECSLPFPTNPASEERLWYYTTGDTLIKMILSGKIWATQISCLNDKQEVGFGLSLMTEIIDITESFRSEENRKFGKFLLQRLRKAQVASRNCFVVCFSEREDDLSQWRAYGGGEGGFSVGFDMNALKSHQVTSRCALKKVNYCETENRLICRKMLDCLFGLYSANPAGDSEEDKAIWMSRLCAYFDPIASRWFRQ